MIVYSVNDPTERPRYYATKGEAITDAKSTSKGAHAGDDAQEVGVEKLQLVKLDKFAILNILNQQGGYVAEGATVATFLGGKRVQEAS